MAKGPVTVIGNEEVTRKIRKLSANVKNKSGLHRAWAASVFKWVIANFESQGAKTGTKWKALAQSTKDNRRTGKNKAFGHKILMDTGALRRSFAMHSSATEAKVASNLVYSKIHQFGGTIKPRTIYPKKKKALSFIVGGKRIFTKKASVGKTEIPARPMLPPKFSLIKKEIEDITFKFIKVY